MRQYIKPELDTIEFDVDDVITVSSASDDSGSSGNPDEPIASETENAYGSFNDFDNQTPGGWF